MKKIFLSIAFVISAAIFLFSCSKNTEIQKEQSSDLLARGESTSSSSSTSNVNLELAYELASNQDFADFVKSYGTNSFIFYKTLKDKDIYKADSSFYCTFWKLKIRLFFIVQCLPFYPLSPSL
jgi:hypothetical protein